MFSKLRKNLLLMNLTILTVLLLLVFGSLYLSNYSEVTRRNNEDLNKLIQVVTDDIPGNPPGFNPERTVSAVYILDQNDTLIDTISQFTTAPDFSNQVLDLTIEDSGTIQIDEYYWAYTKRTVGSNKVIALIDVTGDHEFLNNTLQTYGVILFITLFITAFLSNIMTRISIKPIQNAFQKQKQFVADASHELKTPLTVINANLEALDSSETSDHSKWVSYMKDEVTRMTKLTQDLLYLANVDESEKGDFLKSEINISNELESILLSLEAMFYEKKVTLKKDVSNDIVAFFNKEQFNQVILILLDNAVKYTKNDGEVLVTLNKKGNHIYLSIRNTGNGISLDEQKHIFDRFYKVDKSRSEKSSSFGLGLSIAKTIVENHHGKIMVNSEVDKFTEFTIKIRQK